MTADQLKAPPTSEANSTRGAEEDHGGPSFDVNFRSVGFFILFVAGIAAGLLFVLPEITSLDQTWRRIEEGNPWWLSLCLLFTLGMFAGYVTLFQSVFVREQSNITWRESYQITMASLAATRLFSAGGAGGIVLTAWALKRSGMDARTVADRSISFLVLQYLIYMIAIVVCGYGLRYGIFPGNAPFSVTVVPATLALVITIVGLSVALVPTDFERRLRGFALRKGRIGRLAQRLANGPAAASAGMRDALSHVRHERDPAVAGSVLYWGFQIAVLWSAFHAFGEPPPLAVLVMAFFLGMLGNLLPLPGGIGGVDGGMIGAFVAFGVSGSLAFVAVLVYRGFTFWLPTIPGVIAYLQLRKTVDRWRTTPLNYTN